MSRYDEIAADLAEVFDDIAQPVEWQGETYQAVIADPQVNLDLQTGGFMPQADFIIKLRRAHLPVTPVLGQVVRVAGKAYQISGVTDKPTHPLIILQIVRS